MVTLIKKALARKLAPLFEDMSTDDFSLSFFKGKGSLRDLKLNRSLIQESFPPWAEVETVTCDELNFKVPWANLKKKPVKVMINAINLVVIYDPTKTDLPPIDLKNRGKKNKHDSQEQKFGVGGKYSVIDAAIDGVKVTVKHFNIEIRSSDFTARIALNGLALESPTPSWQVATSLKETRIVDKNTGLIHLFKHAVIDSIEIVITMDPQKDKLGIFEPVVFRADMPTFRFIMEKPYANTAVLSAIHSQVLLNTLHLTLTKSQLRCLEAFVLSFTDTMPPLLEQWFLYKHHLNLARDDSTKQSFDSIFEDDEEDEQCGIDATEEDQDNDGDSTDEDPEEGEKEDGNDEVSEIFDNKQDSSVGNGHDNQPDTDNRLSQHPRGEKSNKEIGDTAVTHRVKKKGGFLRKLKLRTKQDKTKSSEHATSEDTTEQTEASSNNKKSKAKKRRSIFRSRHKNDRATAGGFILYKSYADLIPEKVNSIHIHVEKVLLRLSKFDRNPESTVDSQRGYRSHALLAAVTLNNVLMHSYYKHALGAPIPHSDSSSEFWQAQQAWTDRLSPGNVYANVDHIRVTTTAVSIRRILAVVDATPLPTASSEANTADPGNVDDDDILSYRPRVVLLQPSENSSPSRPMVALAMMTYSHPPTPTKKHKKTVISLPASASFVQINGMKLTADISAVFAVMEFFADSMEPLRRRQTISNKSNVTDHDNSTDAAIEELSLTKESTKIKAKLNSHQDTPTTGNQKSLSNTTQSVFFVQAVDTEVQLPPVLIVPNGMDTAAFLTACVSDVILTNQPHASKHGHTFLNTSQLYNGWLYRRQHEFPVAETPSFLPDVTHAVNVGWRTSSSTQVQQASKRNTTKSKNSNNDTVTQGDCRYIAVDGLRITLSQSKGGSLVNEQTILDRSSLVIRTYSVSDAQYLLLETTDDMFIHVTNALYVYGMNFYNIICALPFYKVANQFGTFDDSETSTTINENTKKSLKFITVPSVTLTVNDGKEDLIYTRVYGVQASITQQSKYNLIRASIQEVIIAQNLSSPSGEIVHSLAPGFPNTTAVTRQATGSVPANSSSENETFTVPQPQILARIEIPAISQTDQKARYARFRQRYEQARRAQHHLARATGSHSTRRRTCVDPSRLRKAAEVMDGRVGEIENIYRAGGSPDSSDEEDSMSFISGEVIADNFDINNEGDIDETSSIGSDDRASLVVSNDFAPSAVIEHPIWKQVEIWSGEGCSQHAANILDNVDMFLASSYAGLFVSAARHPVVLPSPQPIGREENLEYLPEFDALPVTVTMRLHWFDAALDQVPLQKLGAIFSNANVDPLDAFPPTQIGPDVHVDITNLNLILLNGEYLQRLPLFTDAARAHLVEESRRVIRASRLLLHMTPSGTVEIGVPPGPETDSSIDITVNKGKNRKQSSRSNSLANEQSEVMRLRRDLESARDELAVARAQLEQCTHALDLSSQIVDSVQAQSDAALKAFHDQQQRDIRSMVGRLADITSMRSKVQQLLKINVDTTV